MMEGLERYEVFLQGRVGYTLQMEVDRMVTKRNHDPIFWYDSEDEAIHRTYYTGVMDYIKMSTWKQ